MWGEGKFVDRLVEKDDTPVDLKQEIKIFQLTFSYVGWGEPERTPHQRDCIAEVRL